MDRILSSSIHQAREALHSKVFSNVDLVKACLDRIKLIRPLKAYVTTLDDQALKDAGDNDAAANFDRPLSGIPVAVKDNICMTGIRTTCASNMLKDYQPPYSATVVERLKSSGAIPVGKTNMEEFGMGAGGVMSSHGPIKNVWKSGIPHRLRDAFGEDVTASFPFAGPDPGCNLDDDWVIAGGSSGGSAVAVASGSCFAALGSDTGGSVRAPASLNGILGFKPTYGLISRHGLISLVNSLDVIGLMARSAADLATVLLAVAGEDELDSTSVSPPEHLLDSLKQLCFRTKEDVFSSVENLRIGLPREYLSDKMSPEVVAAWDLVASRLSDAGADVQLISMPHTDLACPCYAVLNTAEVASNFARYDGLEYGLRLAAGKTSTNQLYADNRASGFGDVVKGRILAGNYFLLKEHYEDYFEKALKIRRLICEDFHKAFQVDGFDFLLTPVHNRPAMNYSEFLKEQQNYEEFTLHDHCTMPANMAGVPAAVLPVSLSSNGLPISLQVIGPQFSDGSLLHIAHWLEKCLSFPRLELCSR